MRGRQQSQSPGPSLFPPDLRLLSSPSEGGRALGQWLEPVVCGRPLRVHVNTGHFMLHLLGELGEVCSQPPVPTIPHSQVLPHTLLFPLLLPHSQELGLLLESNDIMNTAALPLCGVLWGMGNCLRSHGWQVAELGFEPKLPGTIAHVLNSIR